MKFRSRSGKMTEAPLEQDPISILTETNAKLKQAESLRLQGQLAKAEKICLSLIRRFPDYYGALHTLGLVYGDKGQHEQAVGPLVKAAMLNPHSWTTLVSLAGTYLALGAREMASRTLRDALEINGTEPTVNIMLAQLYIEDREYVLAAEAARRALDREPSMNEALLTLANANISLGNHFEARDALEQILKSSPPTLAVLSQMSTLPAALIRRDLVADLDAAESAQGIDKAMEEIRHNFIRAVAFDKTQRHEDAWASAVKGNTLFIPTVRDEMLRESKLVENRAKWLRQNLIKFKDKKHVDPDYPVSLFILGMSRSGKTTAESLLSHQEGFYRGYENPAISRAVTNAYHTGGLVTFKSIAQLPLSLYGHVREFYKDIVQDLVQGNEIFTNTTPGHIWDAALYYNAVPNVKFVFVKRNFYDVALRVFMKHYRTSNYYSYDLENIKRYWTAYNEVIDLISEALPDESVIINYEDMVEDPAAALEQMCKVCGTSPDLTHPLHVPNDVGCAEPYRPMIDAALGETRAA